MDPNSQQSPAPQQPPVQATPQPAATPTPAPTTTPTPPAPEPKHSSSMGRVFGMLLGVLVVLGLVGGAYYLGAQKSSLTKTANTSSNTVTVSPTLVPTSTSSQPVDYAQLPTPSTNTVILGGGLETLKKYALSVPDVWNVTRTTQSFGNAINSESLEFARENANDYKFAIMQGGGDGGACSYPDKKLTGGIAEDYTVFTEFKDKDGVTYRRGLNKNNSNASVQKYTVCQLTKAGFTNLTTYGWIGYSVPTNASEKILSEMDSIISSLKAQ